MEIVPIEEFKESFSEQFVDASTEFVRAGDQKKKDLKELVSKAQRAGALPFEMSSEKQ